MYIYIHTIEMNVYSLMKRLHVSKYQEITKVDCHLEAKLNDLSGYFTGLQDFKKFINLSYFCFKDMIC